MTAAHLRSLAGLVAGLFAVAVAQGQAPSREVELERIRGEIFALEVRLRQLGHEKDELEGELARTGIDLAAWSSSVQPCPQILSNVPVRERPALDSHPRIGPAIRDEEQRLARSGRLVVRYSGTEPKARIMVEAESRQMMEECAERLRHLIEQEIGRKAG